MKTIAIPIFKSRVSVRLDCAEYIHLITIEKGVVKSRETVRLISLSETRGPSGMLTVVRLAVSATGHAPGV